MSISVECAGCKRTFSAPDNSVGKVAKCPQCGDRITITAPQPEPEEPDDELAPTIPAMPAVVASLPNNVQPQLTGRILFWGGALLLLLATLATTTVSHEETRFSSAGRMHNMPRAAQQIVLMICGMASMLSGAAFLSRIELSRVEQILIGVWLVWVAVVVAGPIVIL